MYIDLKNINKHFDSVHANRNITLKFAEGRIIGILGENGAGKSTLMKILSGYQSADSGSISINAQLVQYQGPQAAIAYGIGMLQQDPLDVGAFTVLENFIFGRVAHGLFSRIFDNYVQAEQQLHEITRRFGFELDANLLISELSIAQRQQLEIVRLLSLGVETLILDEPTTGISAEQKDLLFNTLRDMAQAGMTILLVSHKLEDVIALCDEVAVLRSGELVGQKEMPATKSELVQLMFGEDLPTPERERRDLSQQAIVLALQKLNLQDGRLTIRDVNLQVRHKEIIGFAGLDGSGQQLMMRAVAGLHQIESGTIALAGRDMTKESYHTMLEQGVVFGSAGRIEEGLIAGLSLTEHVALTDGKQFLIDWKNIQNDTAKRIKHYNVRGKPGNTIEQLSGGNQQRVLMALIPESARLMILEQPMRGLDVDSAAWIWEQLLERCTDGSALLFSSTDLDELLTYSDRIVVCFAGEIHIVDEPANISNTQLGYMIGGEFER